MLTFEERIRRQDSFFSSRKPNEFLYGQKSHKKSDEYNSSWLNDAVKQYYEEHNGKLPPRSVCEQLAEAYVKRVRTLIAERGPKTMIWCLLCISIPTAAARSQCWRTDSPAI